MRTAPIVITPPGDRSASAARRARLGPACAAGLALATLLGPAHEASAQSASELARAKQRFHEGEALEARGDCAGAIAAFEQALAVKETPQLHLRIGACEETTGRLVGALAAFERALELAERLGATEVAAVARDRAAALAPRVPTIAIDVKSPPAGLRVIVDGAVLPAGALGAPRRVGIGGHTVRAEAPGFRPFERTLTAAERERLLVAVDLAAAPADTSSHGAAVLPWALVGGGALALGGAVVLGVVASSRASDVEAACGGDTSRCPGSRRAEIDADVGAVNGLRAGAIAAGALGVAGVALGAVLLVRDRRAPEEPRATRVDLVPTIAPGLAGFSARGRF